MFYQTTVLGKPFLGKLLVFFEKLFPKPTSQMSHMLTYAREKLGKRRNVLYVKMHKDSHVIHIEERKLKKSTYKI